MPHPETQVILDGTHPDMDRDWPIGELVRYLIDVQLKYGKGATVRFDAGHNNVEMFVTPSKKVKE